MSRNVARTASEAIVSVTRSCRSNLLGVDAAVGVTVVVMRAIMTE